MDGWKDKWRDGWTDGRDGSVEKYIGRWTDKQMGRWAGS